MTGEGATIHRSAPLQWHHDHERHWSSALPRLLVAADDGHARDVLARCAAEIVRHADARALELARPRLALDLQVHLVEHAQARGADRMAEAFQAAVDLA